jgi:hypothetical protein
MVSPDRLPKALSITLQVLAWINPCGLLGRITTRLIFVRRFDLASTSTSASLHPIPFRFAEFHVVAAFRGFHQKGLW